MKSRLKAMVFGGFIAGSLIMSAAPVKAWDWPWHNRDQQRADNRSDQQVDHRWDSRERDNRDNRDNRGGSASDYEQLRLAKEKSQYDSSHHASRKKIAQDNAAVDEIENRMHHRR